MSCQHGVWIGACAHCKPIHTSKDQQWEFTYPFGLKDRVQIHGKAHFKQECAKRGRTWVGYDDLHTRGTLSRPAPFRFSESHKRKLACAIHEARQQARNPDLVESKLRQVEKRARCPLG